MDPLENLSPVNKILLLVIVVLFAIAVPTGAYILSKTQYTNKQAATTYSPAPKPSPIASILSDKEKTQIEAWITKNNLNNYGDPIDTAYPGGTPLFNEATGKRIDIYEYIDQKHPDRPWCTPRPACLDSIPRCLIAESSTMCPVR